MLFSIPFVSSEVETPRGRGPVPHSVSTSLDMNGEVGATAFRNGKESGSPC